MTKALNYKTIRGKYTTQGMKMSRTVPAAALFTSAQWAALKKKVIIATNKLRAEIAKSGTPDKAQLLADAIDAAEFGGSRTDATRKLFEIFLGKKLPGAGKRHGYRKLAMVVLSKNPNSHNYRLDVPTLAYDPSDLRCIQVDTKAKSWFVGNHVCKFSEGVRVATAAEIESFFRVIPTTTHGDYADTARRYAAVLARTGA